MTGSKKRLLTAVVAVALATASVPVYADESAGNVVIASESVLEDTSDEQQTAGQENQSDVPAVESEPAETEDAAVETASEDAGVSEEPSENSATVSTANTSQNAPTTTEHTAKAANEVVAKEEEKLTDKSAEDSKNSSTKSATVTTADGAGKDSTDKRAEDGKDSSTESTTVTTADGAGKDSTDKPAEDSKNSSTESVTETNDDAGKDLTGKPTEDGKESSIESAAETTTDGAGKDSTDKPTEDSDDSSTESATVMTTEEADETATEEAAETSTEDEEAQEGTITFAGVNSIEIDAGTEVDLLSGVTAVVTYEDGATEDLTPYLESVKDVNGPVTLEGTVLTNTEAGNVYTAVYGIEGYEDTATRTVTVRKEEQEETITFEGIDNIEVDAGTEVDLMSGVTATITYEDGATEDLTPYLESVEDVNGSVSLEGTVLADPEAGNEYKVVYGIEGYEDTATRTVSVREEEFEASVEFSGLDDISAEPDEEVDLLDGVKAVYIDADGNEQEATVSIKSITENGQNIDAANTINAAASAEYVVTYANDVTDETADRKVDVSDYDVTFSGVDASEIEAMKPFDLLEGVTASYVSADEEHDAQVSVKTVTDADGNEIGNTQSEDAPYLDGDILTNPAENAVYTVIYANDKTEQTAERELTVHPEKIILTADCEGTEIQLEADWGVIPDGCELTAIACETTAEEQKAIEDKLISDEANIEVQEVQIYDITILNDAGEEIEPDGTVQVTFKNAAKDLAEDQELEVCHFVDDDADKIESLSVETTATDDAVVTTDSFSRFARVLLAAAPAGSGTAYAVFNTGTGELDFIRSTESHANGSSGTVKSINGKSYSGKIYTGFETKDGGYANSNYESRGACPWIDVRASIKKVVFVDKITPKNSTKEWFRGCAATSFQFNGNLDTSNVTSMEGMFDGAKKIVNIDLTSLNTSNVTTFENMFWGASSLKTVNVSTWNTSKAVSMRQMFINCYNLQELNIANFDMTRLTDSSDEKSDGLYRMLDNCNSLEKLSVGKKAKLKDNHFNVGLRELPTSSANNATGKWTNGKTGYTAAAVMNMYPGNGNGTPATYVPETNAAFAVYKSSDNSLTFIRSTESASNNTNGTIKDIDGTSHTGTIYADFESYAYGSAARVPWASVAASVKRVVFKNTVKPYGTRYYFAGFKNCESFDLRKLDTSSNISMASMFRDCTSVQSLDLSTFNTSKVTNMSHMFDGCTALTALKISNWDTSSCTTLRAVFQLCPSLTELDLSGWDTSKVTDMKWMCGGNTTSIRKMILGSKFVVAPEHNDFTFPHDVTQTVSGKISNQKWGLNSETAEKQYTVSELAAYGTTVGKLAGTWYTQTDTNGLAYAVFTNSGELVFVRSTGIYKNGTTGTVSSISGGTYTGIIYADFENVVYGSAEKVPWLSKAASVKKVVFKDVIKPNATNFYFDGFKNCTSFDLAKLDTSNAIGMFAMFRDCSAVKTLDVSKFDTSKVTKMANVFYGCTSLTSLDVSKWNTSSCTTLYAAFSRCENLLSLDVSNWDVSKVENLHETFNSCRKITSLDVSKWNVSACKTLESAFQATGITSLDLSSWDVSNVENFDFTFNECRSLTYLNVKNWNLASCKSLKCTFQRCSNLTTLDLSGWDTSNVKDMQWLCGGDTSYISKMIFGSKFVVPATHNDYTFPYPIRTATNKISDQMWGRNSETATPQYTPSELTELGATAGKLAGTWCAQTDAQGSAYAVLKSDGELDFIRSSEIHRNNTTGKITSIDGISYTGTIFSGFESWKYGVPKDVPWSSVAGKVKKVVFKNTVKPYGISNYFNGFKNCTTFDLAKLDTSRAISSFSMFGNCTAVKTLDLSNFNTSKIKDMSFTFNGCTSLTTLKLANWNLSSCTTLQGIFQNCSSLTELNLSGWDTSKVTDMKWMCGGDTSSIRKMILGSKFKVASTYNNYTFPYRVTKTVSGKNSNAKWGLSSETATPQYTASSLAAYGTTAGKLTGTWYTQAQIYTVKFNANSGSGSMTDQTFMSDTTQKITANAFTRNGYEFTAWNTKADGTGNAYSNQDALKKLVSSGVTTTLYAQWKPQSYTITYNLNGGSVSGNPSSYNINTAAFTLKNPTRTGYTFIGWTGSNGTTASTSVTIAAHSTGNKSYTANWRANQYTVTCEDWFVDASNNRKVKLGSASKKYNFGATAKGSDWGSDAGRSKYYGNYVYKSSTSATVGTSGATVYRYFWAWTDLNIFYASCEDWSTSQCGATVSFKVGNDPWQDVTNETDSSSGTIQPYGTTYYLRNIRPVHSYEEFGSTNMSYDSGNGWYYYTPEKAGTNMNVWMQFKTYTLTYNGNGGKAGASSRTAKYNSAWGTLATASRTGYTFAGWYTDTSYKTQVTASTICKGNQTVYAKWNANGYTIVFNGNGNTGGSTANESMTYDTAKALTANGFTKSHYHFVSWNTKADGTGTKYTNGQSVKNLALSGTVILYAQWAIDTHTFDLQAGNIAAYGTADVYINGRQVANDTTDYCVGHPYGTKWEIKDIKTKTGITYDGAAPGLSGTLGDSNTVVTLKFHTNSYTVKFAANGGSGTMVNQSFTYGRAQNLNANSFVRAGYTFAGWTCSGKTYSDKQSVNNLTSADKATVTMTAKWTPNANTAYKVVHQQEQLDGSYKTVETQNLTGTTDAKVTPDVKSYTGFKTPAKQTATINGDGSTTITYKYARNSYTVIRRYRLENADGTYGAYTQIDSKSYKYGAKVPAWNRAADTTYKAASIAACTVQTKNETLSVDVKRNTGRFVIKANGGSADRTTDAIRYGSAGNDISPMPTRKGYTLKGLYTAAAGGTKVVNADGTKTNDGTYSKDGKWLTNADVTIYAQWTINKYTISYDTNGGKLNGQKTSYTVEDAAFTLVRPTKPGYTFTGWTGTDLSTASESVTVAKGTTGNRKYTANWKANSYSVVFDSNSGSGSMNKQSMTYDVSKNLAANAFTKTGYTFAGWNTKANGSGKAYADKASVKNLVESNGSVTLYAQWTANTYKVVFKANDGTDTTAEETMTYDISKALDANKFTRDGYTFADWNTKADGTGDAYADKAAVKNLVSSGSVMLYAQWEPVQFKITYNLDGGKNDASNPMTYNATTADIRLADPVKKGYTFKYWTVENDTAGKQYTAKDVVIAKGTIGDKELTAHWSKNPYTVTIPKKIAYINMPIGSVDMKTTFDVTVSGDYAGTVTVKAKPNQLRNEHGDTLDVAAASSAGLFFKAAENGAAASQTDAITLSGTARVGKYVGTVQYECSQAE